MNIQELNPIRIGMEIPRIDICPYCGGRERVVAGIPPLSFSARKRAKLVRLAQYGKCEQIDVPVPAGWTHVEYIESSGTEYIDTGVKLASTDVVDAEFTNNSATGYGGLYGVYSTGESSAFYANQTYYGYDEANTKVNTNVQVDTNWHNVVHDFVNGKLTLDGADTAFTPFTFENSDNCAIFARNYNSSYGYFFNGKVRKFKVTRGDAVVCDLIPVYDGTEYAMYDRVSGTILHNAGTGAFTGGPAVTPTPTRPMDIWCNNGKLKARHQSGLPLEYQQVEYIESSGTQYIDLGYKGGENSKVKIRFNYPSVSSATGSGRVFGSRIGSSNDAFAVGTSSGVVAATGNKMFWCYDAQPYQLVDSLFDRDTWHEVVFSAAEHKYDGVTYGDDYTPTDFETPSNLALFGYENNGTFGYGIVRVSQCKLWDGNTLLRDLIPARTMGSTPVYGFYDLVSGQFFGNDGTGDFTAGADVADPIVVVADGTPEVLSLVGKNLLNSTPYKVGYYIDANGVEQPAGSDPEEYLIRQASVKPNTQYTLSYTGNSTGYTQRWHAYDKDGNWLSQITNNIPSSIGQRVTGTITTPANCYFVRQGGRSQEDYQLELGDTATAYEAYTTQTMTDIPNKLAVGAYKDDYEFISGLMTHKIGVRVLDGTESWGIASNVFYLQNAFPEMPPRNTCICTHLQGVDSNISGANMPDLSIRAGYSGVDKILYIKYLALNNDTDALNAFLAAQYAAGTPVIILYPLATETSEQLEPRTIYANKGANTLDIQAEVEGIEVSLTYKD